MLDTESRKELISDLVFFAKHIGRKVDWGYEFNYCAYDLTYYSFSLHNDEIPESYAKGMRERIEKFKLDNDEFWIRLRYYPSSSVVVSDSLLSERSYFYAEFLRQSEYDEFLIALFDVYRKKADECVTEDLDYIVNAFNKYSIKYRIENSPDIILVHR